MENLGTFTDKGRQSVERICEAAAAVFDQKGYRAATILDVARAASTTKGGIFYYFSTKEELLYVILRRYMDDALASTKRDIQDAKDPRERLRLFVRSHVRYYKSRLHESRLMLRECDSLSGTLTKQYNDELRKKQREYIELLQEIIQQLLPSYAGDRDRTRVLTFSLIGMCNWPFTWFDPSGPLEADTLAETICDIFLGGLPLVSKGTRPGQ